MADRLREAAQAALKALEVATTHRVEDRQEILAARAQLRAALAERKPEPVAWQYVWPDGHVYTTDSKQRMDRYREGAEERIPPESCGRVRVLYTHPPRREWQGLTDEEIADAIRPLCGENESVLRQLIDFSIDEYRAIEAALKEKNRDH